MPKTTNIQIQRIQKDGPGGRARSVGGTVVLHVMHDHATWAHVDRQAFIQATG